MKKIIYIGLFLIGFLAQSQTPFPSGIRLPNATLSDTISDNTRIPIMQANSGNLITKYINAGDLGSGGGDSKFQKISASLSSGQIIIFGDSYTEGSGASSTDKRWSTIFCKYFDATEVNEGDAGATLEKRVPIDYMGAPNMVDRISEIPTKTFTQKMLVFAYGLNDMGQTASAYNTANYKTDYQTVLDAAFSKGWLPEQILLISPYYIGSAGYTAYGGITGNPPPTEARHLDFIQATKEVSEENDLMYIDIYQMQKKNNTALLDVDNIHPNDAGHLYIAKAIYSYFETTEEFLNIKGGTMYGSISFNDDATTNQSELIEMDVASNYKSLLLHPKDNSGNVGQSFSVIPRGTGYSSAGLNIRSQFIAWNKDIHLNPSVQEGFLIRSGGTFYEISSLASGSEAVFRPIYLSALGEASITTTPNLALDILGNVGIGKLVAGINPAYKLDVAGAVRFEDNLYFGDSKGLVIGTDTDMSIAHDGTVNRINLFTSNLQIRDGSTTRVTFERTTGNVIAAKYSLSTLNTAPATSTSAGTAGEIRFTATHIYVCTATNTWVRAALATW